MLGSLTIPKCGAARPMKMWTTLRSTRRQHEADFRGDALYEGVGVQGAATERGIGEHERHRSLGPEHATHLGEAGPELGLPFSRGFHMRHA